MGEMRTPKELEDTAQKEMSKSLEVSLATVPVTGESFEGLVGRARAQIVRDLEDGHLDFEFWRNLGFSSQKSATIVEDALNAFLKEKKAYPLEFVIPYERLRSFAQKERAPECRAYAGRPLVIFGLAVHGLQLIDPNNLIFELQGEASVGTPLSHAVGFLGRPKRLSPFDALGAEVSHDGVLHFHDPQKERKIRSLLQIRMRGGRLEDSYSFFRYGIASRRVWLIQEFRAYFYLKANFENLPFDYFDVVADFNVGLGGDVVNVELTVDRDPQSALFSEAFDAGEFQADTEKATLTPIGYLHDPSHFVDNVARLEFKVWRNPRSMLLRIGLPLLLLAGLLLVGGWLEVDQMDSQVIPAVLVAMVALQLTAVQGMPRDARFSVLDRCFVASYTLAVLLFPPAHVWSTWSEWERKLTIGTFGLAYLGTLAAILYRPWMNRGSKDEHLARFDKIVGPAVGGLMILGTIALAILAAFLS